MAPHAVTPRPRRIDSEYDTPIDQLTTEDLSHLTDLGKSLAEPITWKTADQTNLGDSIGGDRPSRSGASSLIIDSGDAFQLGNTASSSRFDFSPSHSISSNKEDNAGSNESLTSQHVIESNTLTNDNSNETAKSDWLLRQLRAARQQSTNKDGSYFVPLDSIDKLITEPNIYDELNHSDVGPEKDRQKIASQIWRGPPSSPKTTRRRIFAILTLMDKVKAILDIIKEGVYDNQLPFLFSDHPSQVCCKSKSTGEPIRLFQAKWKPHTTDIFEMYQWEMMAPYFPLSCDRKNKVRRMPVDDRALLPFTEVNNIPIEGGFSMVRQVKLHPAHYNALDFPTPDGKPPYFAVKTLNFNAGADDLKNEEVHSLIRLNNENNPNLIRLLFTFQHQEHLHLVFPWADGNLQDFWAKHYPQPNFPPRDHNLAKWVAKQCLGLALGLKAIHHNCVNQSLAKELESDAPHKQHGRHGDFKPENILWFKHDAPISPGNVTGVLKISDFGFVDFHASRSKSGVRASQIKGVTDTYRAPELEVKESVAPSYDLWCFGCVLLEFVEWYLCGWTGVETFSRKRISDSKTEIPSYKEDNFFNFFNMGDNIRKAAAKESVRFEIQELRHHDKCSDFMLDLLEIIEHSLLRMRPEKRDACDEVVGKLDKIYQRSLTDKNYCTARQQPIPEKRKTNLSELVHKLSLKFKEHEDNNQIPSMHRKSLSGTNVIDYGNIYSRPDKTYSNRSSVEIGSRETAHFARATSITGVVQFPAPPESPPLPARANGDPSLAVASLELTPPRQSPSSDLKKPSENTENTENISQHLNVPPKFLAESQLSEKTFESRNTNSKEQVDEQFAIGIDKKFSAGIDITTSEPRIRDTEERIMNAQTEDIADVLREEPKTGLKQYMVKYTTKLLCCFNTRDRE